VTDLVEGIKIIKETRRKRLEAPPPKARPHPWMLKKQSGRSKAYISSRAMKALVAHCEKQAVSGLEALGFLSGSVFSCKGKTYTVVRDALTAPLEATAVHVRFDRTGFVGLFSQLDKLDYEYIIVGWYHSHPGYGCFMSDTDQQTQMAGFSERFHVALVVDPVKKQMMAFRMARGSKAVQGKDVIVPYEEVPFTVYDEKSWPWPGPLKIKKR
jgi:proteasome lid subunit RPN8/RPN11